LDASADPDSSTVAQAKQRLSHNERFRSEIDKEKVKMWRTIYNFDDVVELGLSLLPVSKLRKFSPDASMASESPDGVNAALKRMIGDMDEEVGRLLGALEKEDAQKAAEAAAVAAEETESLAGPGGLNGSAAASSAKESPSPPEFGPKKDPELARRRGEEVHERLPPWREREEKGKGKGKGKGASQQSAEAKRELRRSSEPWTPRAVLPQPKPEPNPGANLIRQAVTALKESHVERKCSRSRTPPPAQNRQGRAGSSGKASSGLRGRRSRH
jgi:hypothetical protein